MGKLSEYRNVIEEKTKGMGQNAFKIKGRIGLESGLVIGMIDATTPDDPAQVRALKDAIKVVLGVAV
jgi:hypothetical protein